MIASGEIEREIFNNNIKYEIIKYTNLNGRFYVGYNIVNKKGFIATIYTGFSGIIREYKGAKNTNHGGISIEYQF